MTRSRMPVEQSATPRDIVEALRSDDPAGACTQQIARLDVFRDWIWNEQAKWEAAREIVERTSA